MDSKWIWIGLATAAAGLIIYVFVRMLFGSISDQMYDGMHAEAKVQLSHICNLEKDYHQKHHTYTTDMKAIGFVEDLEDGSKFLYEVGLADSNRFIARAFCKEDYDQDKQQLTWEIKETCEPVMLSAD